MMKGHSSLSDSPWERGFDLSFKLACEQLAKINDMEQQCRKSGAKYIGPREIVISYLNRLYHIMLPDVKMSLEDSPDFVGIEVPLRDKILILHYFTLAKGTLATGRLITYRQIPGGINYFPAFSQRAITPFVNRFAKEPEQLTKAAAKLGGHKGDYGDVSVVINALPRVPVTFVLWTGDAEVAANGSILFDANISDYLSTEDVAVLSETITWKLVRDVPST
ncbi:MAG: DUF3786 domain-containing protein [Dehalococcoidia bacterium]